MHQTIAALKTLLEIQPADEENILRHSAFLQKHRDQFHADLGQWADDHLQYKLENTQDLFIDGFFEALVSGSYDHTLQASLYHQVLHWHNLKLGEGRVLILLSRVWRTLLLYSEPLGDLGLQRSLCQIVEVVRIVAVKTLSLSRKMQLLKERAEYETARIRQAFSLLATHLPDDLVQAYIDHQQWMQNSISLILGETSGQTQQIPGSHECKLARWLDQGGHALIPADQLSDFETAHHQVHQLASQIQQLVVKQQNDDVFSLLNELENASDIVGRILLECIDESIARFASYDPLTKLRNRTTLKAVYQRELALANRFQKNVGAVLVDIDHFKKINDQYGHLFGDQVLVELAQCLTQQIRQEDILFRWGGEEFLIIGLTETSPPNNIKAMAERIRHSVENTIFCKNSPTPVQFTVSAGVLEFNPAGKAVPMDPIFDHADKLLYQAKQTGRNRVVSEFLGQL